jgi:hypothetical protein
MGLFMTPLVVLGAAAIVLLVLIARWRRNGPPAWRQRSADEDSAPATPRQRSRAGPGAGRR